MECALESRTYKMTLEKNPLLSIGIIPGHFSTASNCHITHYIDVGSIKSSALAAREVASELAIPYMYNEQIDTIVCMENTKVIGAYMASEFLEEGRSAVNSTGDIHVITPMKNINGQLVFYDSEIFRIRNKNILLLTATMSSGKTASLAQDCIEYYGGRLVGISSLFLATEEKHEPEIHALFTAKEIPGYKVYSLDACEMCKKGERIDALISSEGYSKIE